MVTWIGWIEVGRTRANQPATGAIDVICDLEMNRTTTFLFSPPAVVEPPVTHTSEGGYWILGQFHHLPHQCFQYVKIDCISQLILCLGFGDHIDGKIITEPHQTCNFTTSAQMYK